MFKPKKCRECKALFTPFNTLQFACGYVCAKAWGEKKTIADEKKVTAQRKLALKPKSYYLAKAQKQFNHFIRLRDDDNPCISCDRFHFGQYHGGHYRSVGSSPHLRFNLHNCNRQCPGCNLHLSGNLIKYRQGLIQKIGREAVERLEADQTPKHYTIDEIQAIEAHYKLKVKELLNSRA